MSDLLEVRPGAYHDSVSLMQVSQAVGALDGVEAAMVAMATEVNLDLLAGMGFDLADVDATTSDLVVAVRAGDAKGVEAAREAVDRELAALGTRRARSVGQPGATTPRTTRAAVRRAGADLVLVSVPGEHAFVEAMDALHAGTSVMVFSDNVPLHQEIALKAEASRRGLLVMGPDCGTAVVGGVGLGFANVTRPGPVGLVAASGTGLQQLCCLLDGAGVGISHALGVGGRDLSAQVGGASTFAALDALDADEATELLVVLSKPPDGDVAEAVRRAAAACRTPVVVGFVGRGQRDLTEVAAEVLKALGREVVAPRSWPASGQPHGSYRWVRGLFAGGTLCDEAMVIAADALGPVRSNIPLEPGWTLGDDLDAGGHVMVDFGDDAFTRGRAHPMIDNTLRLEQIAREAASADASGRVLLLDVVLGHGAHPDPAAELAPALASAIATARAVGRDLAAVVSLCGTAGDPQGLERQAASFVAAGASVHRSNAEAARTAVALVEGGRP